AVLDLGALGHFELLAGELEPLTARRCVELCRIRGSPASAAAPRTGRAAAAAAAGAAPSPALAARPTPRTPCHGCHADQAPSDLPHASLQAERAPQRRAADGPKQGLGQVVGGESAAPRSDEAARVAAMSKSACGQHTELVSNNALKVTRCPCGAVHVTVVS